MNDVSLSMNLMDRTSSTIYVSNIRHTTPVSSISTIFSKFGPLERCEIPENKFGKTRGFAFIEFENKAHAFQAFDELSKQEIILDGRILKLEWARATKLYKEDIQNLSSESKEKIMGNFRNHSFDSKFSKNKRKIPKRAYINGNLYETQLIATTKSKTYTYVGPTTVSPSVSPSTTPTSTTTPTTPKVISTNTLNNSNNGTNNIYAKKNVNLSVNGTTTGFDPQPSPPQQSTNLVNIPNQAHQLSPPQQSNKIMTPQLATQHVNGNNGTFIGSGHLNSSHSMLNNLKTSNSFDSIPNNHNNNVLNNSSNNNNISPSSSSSSASTSPTNLVNDNDTNIFTSSYVPTSASNLIGNSGLNTNSFEYNYSNTLNSLSTLDLLRSSNQEINQFIKSNHNPYINVPINVHNSTNGTNLSSSSSFLSQDDYIPDSSHLTYSNFSNFLSNSSSFPSNNQNSNGNNGNMNNHHHHQQHHSNSHHHHHNHSHHNSNNNNNYFGPQESMFAGAPSNSNSYASHHFNSNNYSNFGTFNSFFNSNFN